MDIARRWWALDPNAESTGAVLYLTSTDHCYEADVRWDGCVNIYPATGNAEHTHICDVDTFIARLHELKRHALLHFGDSEWPACAPNSHAE